ncbi:mannose-1-phosphate guanylyltransferase [Arcanobacterium phocisimile]|uniref:Mannose-1-phosphate guanylyltransferase n=1 Tax=Arcanobacterium phocisimile TaxID=1302235 RepID=A0ABX7IJP4_9ACTO|nr:mannose-1-phosphate guanylyltransferase [Arcanobacterium phocisimile]
MNEFHAIIPAGGAGTRLWPISRASSPKFLKDLTGAGASLLQQTVSRLAPLAGQNIMVVTGTTHIPSVVRQLPQLGEEQFIAEPSARDSMAAIGLAAAIINQRYGDVVVGSFAADHLISDPRKFEKAVSTAIDAANAGYVSTIGIQPQSPATGFGYIQADHELSAVPGSYAVTEFLEKPDIQTARSYVASGNYFWNAGMFVARADVLLTALEKYEPKLHAGIMSIATAWDSDDREQVLDAHWPELKKIAIDHAIAEPLADDGGIAVVPADMGWTDIGDFSAVNEILQDANSSPNAPTITKRVVEGGTQQSVLSVESTNCTVFTYDRPISLVGVNDVVVVDTGDALLVTSIAHAQNVKDVVEQVRATGRTDLV